MKKLTSLTRHLDFTTKALLLLCAAATAADIPFWF